MFRGAGRGIEEMIAQYPTTMILLFFAFIGYAITRRWILSAIFLYFIPFFFSRGFVPRDTSAQVATGIWACFALLCLIVEIKDIRAKYLTENSPIVSKSLSAVLESNKSIILDNVVHVAGIISFVEDTKVKLELLRGELRINECNSVNASGRVITVSLTYSKIKDVALTEIPPPTISPSDPHGVKLTIDYISECGEAKKLIFISYFKYDGTLFFYVLKKLIPFKEQEVQEQHINL